jgi:DNA segregation ATPase FtsK/SpoIIIE, S-DNA-T family
MIGDKLLAIWVNRLLQDHFKKQKNDDTEKLFIKISGVGNTNVPVLLETLREEISFLKSYFDPIIRTVTRIDGFEEFSYRDYETSTWLRNNTKHNQALVLIINEITPEAQSLENLFTIDEAYLLSPLGLKSLYNLLSEKGFFAPDEVRYIQEFMTLYTSISEPQLSSVLSFLVEILKDPNPSVVDKLQRNLPYLNLFVDTKLKISMEDKTRLKRNFLLANLNIREADQERIMNNVYSFLEEEEKNGVKHEIWENKTVDEFVLEIGDFINQNSNSLLFYDFDFITMVFGFSTKPVKVIDQVKEVLDENKEKFSEDQIKEFENGYDEVVSNSDPDLIQEFIDEFEEELNKKPGLLKKLERLVDKLRNPSEYEDIFQGIQKEIFTLIEEEQGNPNLISSKFKLEILTSKSTEDIVGLLKLYLTNIKNVIPTLDFNTNSLPDFRDESIKDTNVLFEIHHYINGVIINNRKFKVTSFNELDIYSFFEMIEEGLVPYIKNYVENEIDQVNLLSSAKEKVSHYIISNEAGVKENLQLLETYCESYIKKLKYARDFGLYSLESKLLEKDLSVLLENIYRSSLVSQQIYQNINFIGAIDYFDTKKGETGIPVTRKLTVFNPIRLIAYIRRCEEIGIQINEWINSAAREGLQVEKPEEYLDYIRLLTSNLAPRYFASYGDQSYLVENYEVFGEGTFVLNTKPHINSDYLANELSEELTKITKNYLEVYPYAKDGLDILLLFCDSVDIVKKCVDALFTKTNIKKLRLTVHSPHAAKLHNQINKWVEQKEEYTKPNLESKFPKLELNIISGKNAGEIFNQVDKSMSDADMVVLADYFGQSNQISYNLERIQPKEAVNWFETIYKEPLKNDEAVKRISYVSEHLPQVLQHFYQMQYINQTSVMPDKKDLYVLKNLISITNINHSSLIDQMHKKFNWTVILDRYLDKTLLTKTSAQANIIQYKPKAGKNKQFKLIVSSSKYIRKLSKETSDYAYYDRLHRKLVSIMKNENVSRDVVIEAVNKVKDISGGLVLKTIGKGKYAHEMIATYLSTTRRNKTDSNHLQIWAVCDDLPWFANNKRRPDLVETVIEKYNDKLKIHFELVELKFINENIFDKERFDALKQIKTGLSLYNRLFSFNIDQLDSEYWRSELIQYFIERSSYSPEHVNLLKELQHINVKDIEVTFGGSVDVYCYTSNLTEYNFNQIDNGVFKDQLDSNILNYIFTRGYILKQLKTFEDTEPSYDEFNIINNDQVMLKTTLGFTEVQENGEEEIDQDDGEELLVTPLQPDDHEDFKDPVGSIDLGNPDNLENPKNPYKPKDPEHLALSNEYPEVKSLIGIEIDYTPNEDNSAQLRDQYIRKLKSNFNQNGIHLKIKDAIIGSSVIRLVLDLPADLPVNKVLSRSKDIQLWLGLSTEPHIFINKGMKIDIIREEPDTIYFEKFMELTRNQLSDKITGTNLIAPLGLDPLNNVIYMDFSNSMSPHLLTGGTTGSGKSVTLNSVILGIMCLYSPDQVQFLFIDPKKVEFTIYENKQHTLNVITEIDEAVNVLQFYLNEMEDRYTKFAREGVANLDEYIEEVGERLPRIVIVFDEFADFMTQDTELKKQVENAIMRLGQKARAAGIHLIICTQNPKADIINTNIRNNLGARLALRASDANASNVILDESGAEKLAGKGDFLAKIYGNIERGKSPFLTPKVRRALLKYFNREK